MHCNASCQRPVDLSAIIHKFYPQLISRLNYKVPFNLLKLIFQHFIDVPQAPHFWPREKIFD